MLWSFRKIVEEGEYINEIIRIAVKENPWLNCVKRQDMRVELRCVSASKEVLPKQESKIGNEFTFAINGAKNEQLIGH